ncbi:MAG: winged helix-turn-helix domain-containing protein [Candidatus Altiarchaeota archaeon]
MSNGSVIFRSGRLRRGMIRAGGTEWPSDYGRRFLRPLDFNSKIRENAGHLHRVVLKEGKASLKYVKKRTPHQNFLLFASLGWLLREGTIEMTESPEGCSVSLKAA